MLICDLIDAIKPGSIQYNLLKTSATPEVSFLLHLPNLIPSLVIRHAGKDGQCSVCDLHGQKDRCTYLCFAGGHCGNKTEDAPDRLRLSDGKRHAWIEKLTQVDAFLPANLTLFFTAVRKRYSTLFFIVLFFHS